MRALDLFCCAGGATKGLQRAGYHVTGVDIRPQPRYCGDRFVRDDAMAWLRGEREPLDSFDLIWLSPPCQRYSELTPKENKDSHPDLLPVVGDILRSRSVPFIVENVEMAAHLMHHPVMLCGTMFGLNIWRHRYFELGNTDAFFLLPTCNHTGHPIILSGQGSRRINGKRMGRIPTPIKRAAVGIDWMNREELSESIPPCYSEFLARQILAAQQYKEADKQSPLTLSSSGDKQSNGF